MEWQKTTFGELKAGDWYSLDEPTPYMVELHCRATDPANDDKSETVYRLVSPEREALGVRDVACCPVCKGTMIVPAGFYNQTSGELSSAGGVEKCLNCNATGVIIIDAIAKAALEAGK